MDNTRLKNHLDTIFGQAGIQPQIKEIKDEMLINLTEKYNDLIAQGQTEEAAYSLVVASIGDINEIIKNGNPTEQNVVPVQQEGAKKRSAALLAIAVGLYILSVIPCIILAETGINPTIGVAIMFIMIALATGLIIYNNMTKPKYSKNGDTMVQDFRQWQTEKDQKKTQKSAIGSIIWSITVVLYLAISFATGAWHITWIIFLMAVCVQSITDLIITNRK